jgi:ABC-type multidrug transport system ATPase subunit
MIHTLEIDGIQFGFNDRKLLSNIYLKCTTGRITGLLGRNGLGKSSLMKIIYGTVPAEKSVRFDNLSIVSAFKRPDLVRYLPQFNFLPNSRTIGRVLQDFELEFNEFKNKFAEFAEKEKSKVRSLSGGQRRLVELYVIVMSASQFALLDEPFTHLDPLQIEKAKQFLVEQKNKKGIVLTDHLYTSVLDISNEIYVLADGATHRIHDINMIEQLGYK